MRPIALRMVAFGSYAGEESIDFARLAEHGLFVVSGPTGSGKTTLFDAMTYALYGTVAGDRPADVRSHHAAADAMTEVELVFEAEGRRYRVRRTPRSERPKSRGAGTIAVPPSAELYEIRATGEVGLASKPRDVDPWCAELVGLSADQFQRVVLLPQGKCAQFLLCRTDERLALLQQLFGTQVFDRATRLAEAQAALLRRELADVDALAERHRLNALDNVQAVLAAFTDEALNGDPALDLVAIAALATSAKPLVEAEQMAFDELTSRATQARAAWANGEERARQWDERDALIAARAALDNTRDSIAADRLRLEASGRARPVMAAAVSVSAMLAEHARQTDLLMHVQNELSAALAAVGARESDGTAANATLQLERAQARLAAHGERLEGLDAARATEVRLASESSEAAEALADCSTRLEAARERTREHQRTMKDVEPLAATLERCRMYAERCDEVVQRRLSLTRSEAELATAMHAAAAARADRLRVTAAFVADAAPRLAAELVAQQPCPVCGSVEHPSPATTRPGESADRNEFDAALEAARVADGNVERLVVQVVDNRQTLGDQADIAVELLQRQHQQAEADERAAQSAANTLTTLRASTDRLEAETETIAKEYDERVPAVAGLSAQHDQAATKVTELQAAVADLDPVLIARQVGSLSAAHELAQRLTQLEGEHAARSGALGLAQAQRDTVLADSGYADLAAAETDALPDDVVAALSSLVTSWSERDVEVNAKLDAFAKAALGRERPQTHELLMTAETLDSERGLASNRLAELRLRLADAASAMNASQEVLHESASLRLRRETVERVAAMCAGKNRLNVALETWVLAGELERVTAAANVHLALMTRGRYRLDRSDGTDDRRRRGGLDLVVLDADTGRPRSPATLSGGEQFQASLALALGLADVVSQGGAGSGKVFEALFVDEGFGSLDPQALNEAIDALHELHATGRMIGVITHVEAMKRELPTGIEVIVCTDRPGSTLIQL